MGRETPEPGDHPVERPGRGVPFDVEQLLAFLRGAGGLKTLRRQGWVDRGIADPESVADHSYRNALMAWVLGAVAGLDTVRLVKLMLVHDLPEVIVGDATPYAPILASGAEIGDTVPRWRELLSADQLELARARKQQLEADGMAQLAAHLPPAVGEELAGLWTEYAERRSAEAQFAAQVDKLEALLQALEYLERGEPADMANFLASAREAIGHPILVALLEAIEAQVPRQTDSTVPVRS